MMQVLERNGLSLCLDDRLARRKGYAVRLGDVECRMLAALMVAEGVPVSMETLCGALWDSPADISEARVRGVAKRLRNKLPAIQIETIVGEGYRLPMEVVRPCTS